MSEEKRGTGSARYLAMVACVLIGGFVYVGWRIKKGDEMKQQLLLTAEVQGTANRQSALDLEIPQKESIDSFAQDLNNTGHYITEDTADSIVIGSSDTVNSYDAEEDLDIDSLLASIPDTDDTSATGDEAIGGVIDEIETAITIPETEQLPQISAPPPAVDTINSNSRQTAIVEEYRESAADIPSISHENERSTRGIPEKSTDPLDAFTKTTYKVYRVRRGDTLSKIALKFLGSRKKARDIFSANRSIMSSPNRLKVGMNLRIPVEVNPQRTAIHVISTTDSLPSIAMRYYGSAEPEMIEGIRLANPVLSQGGFREGIRLKIPPVSVVSQTPVDLMAHTPAGIKKIYIVKSGDTLSKIAARKYGDGNKWRNIFNANKDKISKPSAIRVGMKLRLP